jgi:excisionase family DNA binding protein
MAESKRTLTLHEAAELLGLHYMTVYRYVRTGRLDGSKDGAEWRVRTADVERLRRSPAAARGRKPSGRRGSAKRYRRRLEDRLVAGDEPGAWALIEGAMASGVEPEEIYLELLVPTLEAIGDGWERGTYSVAQEHQASAVVLRLLGRLSPRFTRRGRKRGSLVLGAPPGDEHGIPVAILTDLLRARGFRVHDLGDNTPAESFAEAAVAADGLVAVGIGATTRGNDRNVRATTRALRRSVDVPILVGGSAVVDADHSRKLGGDGWAASAADAVRLFETVARTGRAQTD